jgi:hypothetical protein
MATCTVSDVPQAKGALIDNAPLRRAFERSGMSAAKVAHAIGWHYVRDGRVCGDATRVECALGLTARHRGSQRPYRAATIDSAVAARIADVLGVDPRSVGAPRALSPSQAHAFARCQSLRGSR